LPERHRFTRGLVAWVGFSHGRGALRPGGAQGGETNYPLRQDARFAVDAITSFSTCRAAGDLARFPDSLFAFA